LSKRCKLVIPDAGPFNSLWVADELALLQKLDMPIIVLDAVYDELTGNPAQFLKDRQVKDFIDNNRPPFIIEETETGREERAKRREGRKPRKNAGDVAIADFMADGVEKHALTNESILILFEDCDIPMVRFFRKPPNLHLLSTVGFLHGLARVNAIASAEAIIAKMTHPTDPEKKRAARVFKDLPAGIDDAAAIGSICTP
jgi:hypothetical protein